MKKSLNDLFKKHGITTRIAFSYIILVLIPFLAMVAIVTTIFKNYSYSSLGNTAMDAISSVGFHISREVKSRKDDSLFVYYNDIVSILSQEMITDEDVQVIEKQLASSTYSGTNAWSCFVIDRGGNTYGSGSYSSAVTMMQEYQEEIEEAGGKCLWYVTDELYGRAGENKYILARRLNNTDGDYVGMLCMVMSDSLVTNAFGQLNSDYSVRYLVDEDGKIFYCSDEGKTGEYLDISAVDTKTTKSYQQVNLDDGKNVVMVSRKIWETGWYCVAVIEEKSILENTLDIIRTFLGISVIYLVFLFVMLYMLQRYVFRPLNELKRTMDQYAQSGLHAVQIETVGVGEIQSLSEHFNRMTVRIDNLVQNYRKEEEEKNRQKLLVMSAQLTPHFIYNSLNTIKWVAVLNHQETIQKLTESLVHIFMNSTRIDEKGYTVSDELELVRNYATIQKVRFSNFDLIIEAEEECLDLRIRKMILQPIVENSILHGLGRGEIRDTEICVKVWLEENLRITVTDHGKGFDVDKWRNSPKKTKEHTNIGIETVEQMIQLEYGEPYGMWTESSPGTGTRTLYILPVIRKED